MHEIFLASRDLTAPFEALSAHESVKASGRGDRTGLARVVSPTPQKMALRPELDAPVVEPVLRRVEIHRHAVGVVAELRSRARGIHRAPRSPHPVPNHRGNRKAVG